METPILFLVFNRPETTAQAFECIRAARPQRLYVAADGPRASRAGEAERCAEVRRIATAVDWPCEVHTLFREQNLGCKIGVSSGIDWFFDHEPEGIILEDDVLPDPSFFPYCAELLARYRDDDDVAIISGCNLIGDIDSVDTSYVFSRYLHIWGWASWRRAWRHYDVSMADWPSPGAAARLGGVLGQRTLPVAHWTTIFNDVAAGRIDTWDYQWVHRCWQRGMVAVFPARNLIRNVGFGADATHTIGDAPAVVAAMRAAPVAFPLRHPVRGDTSAIDRMVEARAYGLTRARWLRNQLARIPGAMALRALLRGGA